MIKDLCCRIGTATQLCGSLQKGMIEATYAGRAENKVRGGIIKDCAEQRGIGEDNW